MTVYADLLFIVNLYIDALLLSAVRRFLRLPLTGKRLLLASVLGGVFGLSALLPALPGVVLFPLALLESLALCAAAFAPKPFDPSVLMAKIRAVLRRTYDLGDRVPVIERGGAVLNLNDETVTHDGQKVQLTRNEFRILQTLMESRGKVVSRETLMTRLWEYDLYIEENTLTVNMTRLRKKLSGIGLTDFIMTRVGSGYVVL